MFALSSELHLVTVRQGFATVSRRTAFRPMFMVGHMQRWGVAASSVQRWPDLLLCVSNHVLRFAVMEGPGGGCRRHALELQTAFPARFSIVIIGAGDEVSIAVVVASVIAVPAFARGGVHVELMVRRLLAMAPGPSLGWVVVEGAVREVHTVHAVATWDVLAAIPASWLLVGCRPGARLPSRRRPAVLLAPIQCLGL